LHIPSSFFLSSPPPRINLAAVPFIRLILSNLTFALPVKREGQGETYFRPINIANAVKIPPKIKPWAK
jgi:hypothetical protein